MQIGMLMPALMKHEMSPTSVTKIVVAKNNSFQTDLSNSCDFCFSTSNSAVRARTIPSKLFEYSSNIFIMLSTMLIFFPCCALANKSTLFKCSTFCQLFLVVTVKPIYLSITVYFARAKN